MLLRSSKSRPVAHLAASLRLQARAAGSPGASVSGAPRSVSCAPPRSRRAFSSSSSSYSYSSSSSSSSSSASSSSPRFSYVVAESYSAKKRSETLAPATFEARLLEERGVLRKQLEQLSIASQAAAADNDLKTLNSHQYHSRVLLRKLQEIDSQLALLVLVQKLNLHAPLDFLKQHTLQSMDGVVDGSLDALATDTEILDRDTGEDSFFFTPTEGPLASKGIAFGVADGVGGWAAMGVDPSAISKGLCFHLHRIFCTHMVSQLREPDSASISLPAPKALLNAAFSELKEIQARSSNAAAIAGGTTACVGIASASTGTLHLANLGDSGAAVFRSGKIALQSTPQVHAFNTPYQLSIIPDEITQLEDRNNASKEQGRRIADTPLDADTASFQLKHGDVVVIATDGFLDNVFPSTAVSIVTNHMLAKKVWKKSQTDGGIIPNTEDSDQSPGLSQAAAGNLAHQLVMAAYNAARNPKSKTPFAKEFMDEFHAPYSGGKPDDTTVLVIYVQEATSPAPVKAKL